MGKVDFIDLEKFAKQIEKVTEEQITELNIDIIKELAARLLTKVIKLTPVGDYSKQVKVVAKRDSKHHKKGESYTKRVKSKMRQGGVLRRGWTSKTHAEAEDGKGRGSLTQEFINSMEVKKEGNNYVIEIINPVNYASYVEYGHRTRNHKGWVKGKFMLKIAESELESETPRILENKLNKFFGEMLNV